MTSDPLIPPRQYWDQAAPGFDEEADHGLRDPSVRSAWRRLLKTLLPSPGCALLDAGCGTGTLSVLLAELGQRVAAIDISPAMLGLARVKAAQASLPIEFMLMDASAPQFEAHSFDAILCRHLLWSLPDPRQTLLRWQALLRPGGQLIMIEGHWSTGAGLRPLELLALLPPHAAFISVYNLSDQPIYWGKAVTDERYALTASYAGPRPSG